MARTPTPRPAPADEAFLREVDDALRRSDLENFWSRWGKWLLGVVVLGLAAFGFFLWWQQHREQQRGQQAEAFVSALDQLKANRPKTADAKFKAFADSADPGYRLNALLMRAGIAVGQGDSKRAAALYRQVETDAAAPELWRNLALIRRTMAEFDSLPPQEVITRMKPLAAPGNPWFGSAGEMTAIAWMKLRRPDMAGPMFAALAKDEGVPRTIRGRARQLAGQLGIDAVQLSDTRAAPGAAR